MDNDMWVNSARALFYTALADLYRQSYWGHKSTITFILRDGMFKKQIGDMMEAEVMRLLEEYGILKNYKHTIYKNYNFVEVIVPEREVTDDEN